MVYILGSTVFAWGSYSEPPGIPKMLFKINFKFTIYKI